MSPAPQILACALLLAAAAPAVARSCEGPTDARGEAALGVDDAVSTVVPRSFARFGRLLARGGGSAAAASPAPACQSGRSDAPTTKIDFPSDIPVPADAAARKQAFLEFSRYSCSDCEGGRGYDAWVRQVLASELKGYNAFETRVGAMAVGEVLTWKTPRATGTLTVLGEAPEHGFRCKTLRYELRKGRASAERPGLFCYGKANRYAAAESWVEVY